MKTHNGLKKLLQRFVVDLTKQLMEHNTEMDVDKLIDDYASCNSLTSTEQKT